MPTTIEGPKSPVRVTAEPITAAAFAPFGALIEDPARRSQDTNSNGSNTNSNALKGIIANQGSATKYVDVTSLEDVYAGQAPSGQAARVSVSMFVCKPRNLVAAAQPGGSPTDSDTNNTTNTMRMIFPVRILERHPFTSQTFTPLGVGEAEERRYLVIVAPSQEAQSSTDSSELSKWPYPTHDNFQNPGPAPSKTAKSALRGPPDLSKLKAFMVKGSQAVTYGAGTWHAPMVALGTHEIPFVVLQFANGVAIEDCQEVEIPGSDSSSLQDGGVAVLVPPAPAASTAAVLPSSSSPPVPAKL